MTDANVAPGMLRGRRCSMTKAQEPAATLRKRRHFTAEFKLEAVRRAEERCAAGVPLTQVARELGVTDDLLRGWRGKRPSAPGRRRLTASLVTGGCRARRTRCDGSGASWRGHSRRSPS